jgi:hypothetical protein
MDENRETFETEGEAIAFCEGLDAAVGLLNAANVGTDAFDASVTYDRFVEGDRWVVTYE